MKLIPVNRHLLVKHCERNQKEDEISILLPEDYRPSESEFATVEVIDWADSVSLPLESGDLALISRGMLQQAECCGDTHYLILENYVIGIVRE
jgi:hypothetical protein